MSKGTATTTLTAIAVALGAAGAFTGPAEAGTAPTITLTNPQRCFVNTFAPTASGNDVNERNATVRISGAGWHPGAQVQLDFAGVNDEVQKTASANGTFTASFQLPEPELGYGTSPTYQSLPIIAVDFGDGDSSDLGGSIAITPKVNFTTRQVNVWEDLDDVYGPNSLFHPSDPVEFKASGFTPGKPVYAHYLFNGSRPAGPGQLVSTVNLGTATGPCGILARTASIFPATPLAPDAGDYSIHYSSSRAYSPRASEFSWPFKL
jgi:hypothetical protein